MLRFHSDPANEWPHKLLFKEPLVIDLVLFTWTTISRSLQRGHLNCFSLCVAGSRRRANAGLNHVVRVSIHMQNKWANLRKTVELEDPTHQSMKCIWAALKEQPQVTKTGLHCGERFPRKILMRL